MKAQGPAFAGDFWNFTSAFRRMNCRCFGSDDSDTIDPPVTRGEGETTIMHEIMLIIALLPAMLSAQTGQRHNVWGPLKYFVGTWEGTAESRSGRGTAERECRFILDGSFLQMESTHVYDLSAQLPEGQTHEGLELFSYDRARKALVMRQFHSEGFVNQYRLDSLSADSTTIVFVSEWLENAPPGWRAKEQYEIIDDDEFIEIFKLAPPGGEFEVYWETHLKRKDQ
jgi:hypothetical protein